MSRPKRVQREVIACPKVRKLAGARLRLRWVRHAISGIDKPAYASRCERSRWHRHDEKKRSLERGTAVADVAGLELEVLHSAAFDNRVAECGADVLCAPRLGDHTTVSVWSLVFQWC